MNPGTSTSWSRRRLLILAITVSVLAIAAWGFLASGDRDRSTADDSTAPSAHSDESASSDEPASSPSDPPTVMPDGSPIPSPSPGTPSTIGQGTTEAVEPVSVLPPVGLDETGDFGTGVTVQLSEIEATEGVARAPGEIAGPALEVTVQADNDSAEPVSLDGVVVFLSYGTDRTPATDFGQGSTPLSGSLAAGSSATGTYVFAVPEDQRDDVWVEISYTGEAPTLAFRGPVD